MIAVVVSAVVALGADAVYSVVNLRSALRGADGRLQRGALALTAGRLDAATGLFQDARSEAASAGRLAGHPSIALGTRLPGIGGDARAFARLASAADLAARAGLVAVRGADAAGAARHGLARAIFRNERVQFDSISAAAPYLSRATGLLQRASTVLGQAGKPLLASVRHALGGARSEVDSARSAAERGGVLLHALPALFARGTMARYFLAFQTPGEERGTGGLIGLYGVLRVDDGRVRLTKVAGIADLTQRLTSPVAAPTKWFGRAYGPDSGLRQLQQANLSPDFPVVSRVLLEMYEQATGRRLDGVIAMDPIALGDLTTATGPLRVRGLKAELGPDNAATVLLHDVYLRLPGGDAQTAYISRVVRQFWARVRSGAFDPAAMATALSEAAATQHFKVFATSGRARESLHRLGADGDFGSAGPNVQLVFNNNFGSNKIDYFLHRRVDTRIALHADGSARVVTHATLHNTAGDGPPSPLLGGGQRGYPVGYNQMSLHFLLPRGARVDDFRRNGKAVPPFGGKEGGYRVAWYIVKIPPGRTADVSVSYSLPHAVTTSPSGAKRFTYTLWPQATVVPDRYSVEVVPPEGRRIAGDGASAGVRISGILDRPQTIGLDLDAP